METQGAMATQPIPTRTAGNGKIRHQYTSRMEWLRLADLQVEPGVTQRPFDPAWAQYLTDNFDPDLVGYPLVVLVGIRHVIIDGQHRCAAARQALGEDQRIQCELVEGISVQRAAQLFIGRNRQRRVTPLSTFMVGITAKIPEVLAINQAVTNAGWKVGAGGAAGVVSAVGSLQRMYRLTNDASLVSAVLTIVRQAWGLDTTNANGDFMAGLALLLHRHPGIDQADMAKRLQKQLNANRILAAARSLREGLGGSVATNVARTLATTYNSGRRTGKIAWGVPGSDPDEA
jgi:hypothetical protein